MKYFYDTEFIEDGSTVDLISIGIVADDGREYYAVSTEFKPSRASQWVKDNVLIHLPPRPQNPDSMAMEDWQASKAWKPRGQIARDLLAFCDPKQYGEPEFWAYYAAYDHVALCQLFGTMMDLPKGWPMYTNDLQQLRVGLGNVELPEQESTEHHALADARWTRDAMYHLIRRLEAGDFK